MIVHKRWSKRVRVDLKHGGYVYDIAYWEGWFLLGVLPLYIRQA